MRLADRPKQLARAMRKLKADQGRIARNNARRVVMRLLVAARRELDMEWPVDKKEPKKRRKRSTQPPSDYTSSHTNIQVTAAITAGIRLRVWNGYIWMPKWVRNALDQGATGATLRRCKHSKQERAAWFAAKALQRNAEGT